jgi:hypothetical protein
MNKFDEITKQMAQSVTRRQALKRFGVGLSGMALACFGLANKARAGGTNLCCTYECYNSIMGGKPVSSKVCVGPGESCPPPGGFCSLKSSRPVADCKTCR